MKEQQASKTFRHGEGSAHESAKTRLVKILMDAGWEVFPDSGLTLEWRFESQNAVPLKPSPVGFHSQVYYHEFDIYCRKEHSNGLTSEKIFEIDGSSHEKKKQQNRDDTAEKYAEFFLPDCPVYRVPISELIGPHKRTDAELWILYKLR